MKQWVLVVVAAMISGCGIVPTDKTTTFLASAQSAEDKSCTEFLVAGSYDNDKVVAAKNKLLSTLPSATTSRCNQAVATGLCTIPQSVLGVKVNAQMYLANDVDTNTRSCKLNGGVLVNR